MSYRISLGCTRSATQRRLKQVDLPIVKHWVDREQFTPKYNIGPSGNAAVLLFLDDADGDNLAGVAEPRLVLRTMPWGIVTQEQEEGQAVKDVRTNITGAEGLRSNVKRWRGIRESGRCAIVCQGYHLWHHTEPPGSSRDPYFVRFEDKRPMFLAGLYDGCSTAADPSDVTLRFVLLTTEANSGMKWLKGRQPVILSTEADVMNWLDVSSGAWSLELLELLRPHDMNDMTKKLTWYQVPKEVSSTRKNSRKFIRQVYRRSDGIETAIAQMEPDIVEMQPPQVGVSMQVAYFSQSAMTTHGASVSSQATATASSSTQAQPTQPVASIPASQGVRPTQARARPKPPPAGVHRTPKAKKRKDAPVPPKGRITHYFTSSK